VWVFFCVCFMRSNSTPCVCESVCVCVYVGVCVCSVFRNVDAPVSVCVCGCVWGFFKVCTGMSTRAKHDRGAIGNELGSLSLKQNIVTCIGLFYRALLPLLQGSFAKETYNFKEPANRSHPVSPALSLKHM